VVIPEKVEQEVLIDQVVVQGQVAEVAAEVAAITAETIVTLIRAVVEAALVFLAKVVMVPGEHMHSLMVPAAEEVPAAAMVLFNRDTAVLPSLLAVVTEEVVQPPEMVIFLDTVEEEQSALFGPERLVRSHQLPLDRLNF